MKNIGRIKERYLRESFNKQIGHLSSDLFRISTFNDIRAILDLVEESKFFIEWVAPNAPFDIQVFLSDIQRKLALWERGILKHKEKLELEKIRKIVKDWSDKLLEISGLLVT